jgi:hypothetical protein
MTTADAARRARWPVVVCLAIALFSGAASVQQAAAGAAAQTGAVSAPVPAPAQAPGSAERVALDRVVAIVNSDLILESDVDAEERMAAFQPLRDSAPVTRDQLIDRLIDRDLVLQQIELQREPPVADAELDDELNILRKAIPECATYRCETDAGWERFVADHGFTLDELRERWRERMEVLRFIEQRFRMGIRTSQAEIDDYYRQTILPAYEKQRTVPPPEVTIADKIQEILLQQQVNKLLDDWLTSLRAQGMVRMVKPGEELP